MPQPAHEPFSRRQKQFFACSPTRLSSIAQPSSPTTPDQWPSTAQERVEIAHHLPSSYLRRTMLHSHIVHSAPGGVTAHSSSSRCSCHIGTMQLVITNAKCICLVSSYKVGQELIHPPVRSFLPNHRSKVNISSIERFSCFTCEDLTLRRQRAASPRHQNQQPIRLHEWLRPSLPGCQASLSRHFRLTPDNSTAVYSSPLSYVCHANSSCMRPVSDGSTDETRGNMHVAMDRFAMFCKLYWD
jgi:hypothetical protein